MGVFPRAVISPEGQTCCCQSYSASAPNRTGVPHSYHTMHTMLLPYIDQANVYNKINMSLRYDNAANGAAVKTQIPVYICPSDNRTTESSVSNGVTFATHNYAGSGSNHPYGLCGYHGASGVFAERNGQLHPTLDRPTHATMKLKLITDGTSNTICFSEFAQNKTKVDCGTSGTNQAKLGWARPYVGNTAYTIRNVSTPNGCNGTSSGGSNSGIARSWHVGGVHVLMVDGSVHFVGDSIDGPTWQNLHTFSDGNVVNINQ